MERETVLETESYGTPAVLILERNERNKNIINFFINKSRMETLNYLIFCYRMAVLSV